MVRREGGRKSVVSVHPEGGKERCPNLVDTLTNGSRKSHASIFEAKNRGRERGGKKEERTSFAYNFRFLRKGGEKVLSFLPF